MSHLLGASESSINSNHRLSSPYSFSSSIMSSLSIIKVLRLYTHLFLYFGVLFNTYASGALLPSRLAVIGDPIGPNQQQPNEEEYSSNVISSPLSLSLNQIEKTTGRKQPQQQQRNANGLLEKLNPRERNELKNLVDEYLKLTAFETLENNNDDDDESSSEQAKLNFINRLYDDVDADGVVRYLRKKLGNIDDYGSVEYDEDDFDGFGKEETVDIDSDGIYKSNSNNNKFNLLYKKLNIQQKKRSSPTSDNNNSYNNNHSNKGTNAKKQITIEDIEKAYKIWLRTNAKKYSIEQLKLIHAKFLKLKQEIAQMEEYDKFLNFQRVIYSHGR